MKKLYFLDEEERQRILNIHESATKRQYLKEQDENETRKNANNIDSIMNSIKDPSYQPEALGGYNNQTIEKNAAVKSAIEQFKNFKFPTQSSETSTGTPTLATGTSTAPATGTATGTATAPATGTAAAPATGTAAAPATGTSTAPVTGTAPANTPLVVTNYDRAYDYKLENGKYLFKGKDNTKYGKKYPNWQESKTTKGANNIKSVVDNAIKLAGTSVQTVTQNNASTITKPDASSEVAKKTAEAGTQTNASTATGQNTTTGAQPNTSTATGQNAASTEGGAPKDNQTASSGGGGVSDVDINDYV
jgi:hypothetical protein